MTEKSSPVSVIPGTHNYDDYLDKRLIVVLRDGRRLLATLCSFDQFGNLLLHSCVERFYVDLEFAEEHHTGAFLVRGENVALVGLLDEREWPVIDRRMSKFRRPLAQLYPRWQAAQRALAQRNVGGAASSSDEPIDLF